MEYLQSALLFSTHQSGDALLAMQAQGLRLSPVRHHAEQSVTYFLAMQGLGSPL